MRALLLSLLFSIFVYAETTNIYRIGSASVEVNGKDAVNGTLFGYKRHVSDGELTFGADLNYIMVSDNIYGVDDTAEAMLHVGAMGTDAFEYYGSFGYAVEDSAGGFGWGFGLVYDFTERFSVTYEYRRFSMEDNSNDYTLKSASLGLLIRL